MSHQYREADAGGAAPDPRARDHALISRPDAISALRADPDRAADPNAGLNYDATGPLEGWRLWRCDGRMLTSWARGIAWPPGKLVAEHLDLPFDRQTWHVAPASHCQCGLYVVSDLHRWPDREFLVSPDLFTGATILGRARVWGRVFPHEAGWRAQYARPIALVRQWGPGIDGMLRQVAGIHGCDVIEPDDTLRDIQEEALRVVFPHVLNGLQRTKAPPAEARGAELQPGDVS